MPDTRAGAVRPILKWAGGKRQLLPELRPFYPRLFDRYLEPFLGSGAVFLDLLNGGRLDGRRVRLSDINADVIGCYRAVRDSPSDVIKALRKLETSYKSGGAAHFYDVRDQSFNPARRAIHASADPAGAYTPLLAAMLIFLNRTGFNGLFRVNARGEFNVPAGRYGNPKICDEANLRAWSAALANPRVSLGVSTFDAALADAGQDDFVYLDPPYAPLSGTARFTSYTAGRLRRGSAGTAAAGGHRDRLAEARRSCSAIPRRRRSARSTPGAARPTGPGSAPRPSPPGARSTPGRPVEVRFASTSLPMCPGVNYTCK